MYLLGRRPVRSAGQALRARALRSRALRSRALRAGLAAALLLTVIVPAASGILPIGKITAARADDDTASLNDLRTGWDPHEPGLRPGVVGGKTFGERFSRSVDGEVYAQPVVVGSTVVVATEDDHVYGLNAQTGAVKWSDSLGTPYHITDCTDLVPDIGITGTPVYDARDGDVYLIAQVMRGLRAGYRMFGISVRSGSVVRTAAIGGHPANDSSITFDAKQQLERPGLLLMNGRVYGAFGSHCDVQPYAGFVTGVSVSTGRETLWTDESGVTDNMAGIWHGGGGLMSDGSGRIFVTSGNGVSPPPGPGGSPPGQLAESVIRLGVRSNGTLAARDFFSPANAPTLDAGDTDFGSGGPVGLPFGTGAYPSLLVQAGKDGRVFLLNRDNLGGREQGPGGTDDSLATYGPFGGDWGHPAVFGPTRRLTAGDSAGADDFLYLDGRNDYLRVFRFGATSAGRPTLSDVAGSAFTFGYTSGSPVVTSDGTVPSSAVAWVAHSPGATGAGATLDAFRAVPGSGCKAAAPCTLSPIWSAPIGIASKFTIPATSNGVVYVGTRGGRVLAFGSVSRARVASRAPLTGAMPVAFDHTAVGTSAVATVTQTATAKVTVTGVSAASTAGPGRFSVGQVTETVRGGSARVPVRFPVALSPGDLLHAPVRFSPSGPGGATGTLAFHATSASFPAVNVPLSGNGTRAGL